ncbi:aromatic acid exporter family member 1 [Murinocardiopsis flavida]|uniref:Aromatic acid exporter family member 1 n=1 Tax=Murinocardiopsis flavida TaxID=645275 RepID=A0A2P8D590_9ACTN|nr:aromatic acid exporter family protein [Murinocardiopsis flavida]PSK92369.1 aromatic acid exporter family member 1 [Murinocardiopsis flavida]
MVRKGIGPATVSNKAVPRAARWFARARDFDGHERHVVLILLKSAVAATAAWVLANDVMGTRSPAFAPFSAVLMVQVTVYRSLSQSLRHVAAVTLGVAIQIAAGLLAGPDMLTFALVCVITLAIGQWSRLGVQGPQVATAAFFAFSQFVSATDLSDRLGQLGQIVGLVLLGSAIGVAVNLLLFPPLRYRSARYAIAALAASLGGLLTDMAQALRTAELADDRTSEWWRRANQMDRATAAAQESVYTAEESAYYNPARLLRRNRSPLPFEAYRTLIDALGRASGDIASIARGLHYNRPDDPADPAVVDLHATLSDLLEAVGRTAEVLADLDTDGIEARLDAIDGHLASAADACARLKKGERSTDPRKIEQTRGYEAVIVDATRLVEDIRTAFGDIRAPEGGTAP